MSVLTILLGRSPVSALSCPARRLLRGRDLLHDTWARSRHALRHVRDTPGLQRGSSPLLSAHLLRALHGRPAGHLPLLRPCAPTVCGTERQQSGKSSGGEDTDPAQREQPDLYENPWTIPNLLSMTRIGLSPVLGYLIVGEDFNLALGIFVLAGITDLLDGYIARNWANQKSALGSALDPLADKILISVLYVCLTYANLIPVPLTVMIILRDIALIGSVFYVRYKTLPPPRTLGRYFNPCHVTAQLEPTFISKMNTAVQLILVAASLSAPVFDYVDSVYLQALWCITAFTTVASGYSYYHYGQKTVKVLNNK
ncbi:cardiolipin synthase (CMP-forming) [Hyla sarda]|uniref:cardiolipin synthase (CMP-forming) n=1 Tax=Hyla sarda TaxID=327740 RepID=UPI0024C3D4F1|nr:cardiolipin synthase (CMP-forming) [Hyla sarda]